MNLRTLLAAARAAGWRHEITSGSFGLEHVWKSGPTSVHLEQICGPAGSTYTELTVIDSGHTLVTGRVGNVDQAVALLAAYGITVPATVVTSPIEAFKQRVEAHRAAGHRGGVAGCKTCPTPVGAVA